MQNERPWFVRVKRDYRTDDADIEQQRQHWQNAAGFETTVKQSDSETHFVFDATKPVSQPIGGNELEDRRLKLLNQYFGGEMISEDEIRELTELNLQLKQQKP